MQLRALGVLAEPYRNLKPVRSMSTPYSSRSNGTSPGAQLQSAARLATLPARLHRRRLGPAARGDKHRGSGKRCRSGVRRTHLTAVPTELQACLMRAPASASPSIGPHSRPQHGRQQRDQGQRLAVSAEELPLIWCVHALIIARDLSLTVRTLKPVYVYKYAYAYHNPCLVKLKYLQYLVNWTCTAVHGRTDAGQIPGRSR